MAITSAMDDDINLRANKPDMVNDSEFASMSLRTYDVVRFDWMHSMRVIDANATS